MPLILMVGMALVNKRVVNSCQRRLRYCFISHVFQSRYFYQLYIRMCINNKMSTSVIKWACHVRRYIVKYLNEDWLIVSH